MTKSLVLVLLLASGEVLAADAAPVKRPAGTAAAAPAKPDVKKDEANKDEMKKDESRKDDPNLGMSILGNQEAPKALVIVPWKRSEIGDSRGFATMLDDSRLPIDKEVFMRMLSYYGIMSETTRHDGAPTAVAAHGRKE